MPYASLHLSIPTTGATQNHAIRQALGDMLSYKDLVISLGGYIQDEAITFDIFLAFYQ